MTLNHHHTKPSHIVQIPQSTATSSFSQFWDGFKGRGHHLKRGSFQNEWGRGWGGGGENLGEKSPNTRCLCASLRQLPLSSSPPWFPGGSHPSKSYPSLSHNLVNFRRTSLHPQLTMRTHHISSVACRRATGKAYPCSSWASSCHLVWLLITQWRTHWKCTFFLVNHVSLQVQRP